MPRRDIPAQGAVETVLALAARTASGDSGPVAGYGAVGKIRVQLDVTAVAGLTPTLDVVAEDTLDGVNWNTIGTFTQKTTVSRQVIDITSPFADRIRYRWTVGGSAGQSFTFSVTEYTE